MFVNIQDTFNYHKQTEPYIEVISADVSSDGTFNNLNDLFEKLSIKIKPRTDKEQIFNLYKDCVYFGNSENKKLNEYIKSKRVEEKESIFDYYD